MKKEAHYGVTQMQDIHSGGRLPTEACERVK